MPQEPPSGLDEAIAHFLMVKKALSKGTQANYQRVLYLYKRLSPDWPPTTEGVITFIVYCQENHKGSTIHSYWSVVRGFVRFLVKKKLIRDNPLEEISPPKKPDELPRAPPTEQIKKLIEYLESEVVKVLAKKRGNEWGWRWIRNLALFSLILDTGLRISEALSVQVEDVSLVNGSVYVRNPKGGKSRFVFFGKKAKADIKLWCGYRERVPIPEDYKLLFFTNWGDSYRQMTPSNAQHVLWRICARLGIEPAFSPHDLRHFYAGSAFRFGANPENVRKQLGHSNLKITSRYAMSWDEGRAEDHLYSSPRDRL